MNKIVVVVSGGCLQAIYSNLDVVVDDVVIIDYDEVGEGEVEEEDLDTKLEEETRGMKEIF